MKGHNLQFEEFHIPKPIRLPLHGLDLVVGPFQRTGGDGEIIVGEDAGFVSREHFRHSRKHADSRG